MRYWWVNHKQTFSEEVDGGYIWSPKKNINGSFNKTYLNLTYTSIGDIVFSYADTLIKAIGIVKSNYTDSIVPQEFGIVGNQWDKDGYLVPIEWTKLVSPFKPKDSINSIKSLLPTKYSPIQQNGNGNQGVYLAEIDPLLGEKLIELISIKNILIKPTVIELEEKLEEDAELRRIEKLPIPKTEKERLIMARIGQGFFRDELIKIEKGCRVTGVMNSSFLIASHIKPWSKSEPHEKIDGNNGLLLSPHVDRLFDRGHLSFSDDGDILIKNEVKDIINIWGIAVKNVGKFNNKQREYLAYHRGKFNF